MSEGDVEDLQFPQDNRSRFKLAHFALNTVFNPFGDQSSFTFRSLKDKAIKQGLPGNMSDTATDEVLKKLHDTLLENGWLDRFTTETINNPEGNFWDIKYQIGAITRPSKIRVEKYLQMLSEMAGEQESAAQHASYIANLNKESIY